MLLRLVSTLLTGFALFFAPVTMASSSKAVAHTGSAQMAGMPGHCSDAPADREQDDPMKIACANACAAWPSHAPTFAPAKLVVTATYIGVAPDVLSGLPPESATPPPRSAPQI